ncbi:glycoside hydrolase family 57 protein [Candidatus Woesearchaeota archaeon]|nr:glycoside hydrolase family 57 protein [Candidatus Woesearchaeota archaeon]
MVSVCFYFQVHQPYRIRDYRVFDIGSRSDYFDSGKNSEILSKVIKKCYCPANKLMLELIHKNKGEFKVSYSMTGILLEQLEKNSPNMIESFRELVDTGCVELLSETYHHSLSFLYSKKEFKEQVRLHRKKLWELFRYRPSVFRNTELIYNNELAELTADMGYKGVLAEGADHILQWRNPNFVYKAKARKNISLLLKNYRLSDDIAFRFSEKSWKSYPLTAPKFAGWVNGINGNGHIANLFMDYETFGEHQWEDKGIFSFLKHLPEEILKNKDNDFISPSGSIERYPQIGELDFPFPVSWADVERDVSAWLGNRMQQEAARLIYDMECRIKESRDKELIDDWRKLQTSDHFYYMCTKWFADGDVHKYFNPFERPYDSFISFMNILNDIRSRIQDNKEKITEEVRI